MTLPIQSADAKQAAAEYSAFDVRLANEQATIKKTKAVGKKVLASLGATLVGATTIAFVAGVSPVFATGTALTVAIIALLIFLKKNKSARAAAEESSTSILKELLALENGKVAQEKLSAFKLYGRLCNQINFMGIWEQGIELGQFFDKLVAKVKNEKIKKALEEAIEIEAVKIGIDGTGYKVVFATIISIDDIRQLKAIKDEEARRAQQAILRAKKIDDPIFHKAVDSASEFNFRPLLISAFEPALQTLEDVVIREDNFAQSPVEGSTTTPTFDFSKAVEVVLHQRGKPQFGAHQLVKTEDVVDIIRLCPNLKDLNLWAMQDLSILDACVQPSLASLRFREASLDMIGIVSKMNNLKKVTFGLPPKDSERELLLQHFKVDPAEASLEHPMSFVRFKNG